jgi:hypothetical protein
MPRHQERLKIDGSKAWLKTMVGLVVRLKYATSSRKVKN